MAIVLVVEEALHNVPRVGEVYNQQMSDHHMQALLALSKYKADRGLDALEQTRNNDDVEIGLG
ncbi:MAG: hypothetical protein F9K47_12360 [Burkholderiales bacterium]|nr:MAG: hypothetical protein F9K47_12360 [Burkholderiales bacterium]